MMNLKLRDIEIEIDTMRFKGKIGIYDELKDFDVNSIALTDKTIHAILEDISSYYFIDYLERHNVV